MVLYAARFFVTGVLLSCQPSETAMASSQKLMPPLCPQVSVDGSSDSNEYFIASGV